ncbi:carbohydrate porin [Gimesia panareensis]|uniref:Porin B n=1 Tax=Gimesia panareensis TaxID=2527978 RepID=A0A518A601_9PLAN|nr:carbohydrate porin [Gimesia panareensis]QDT26983.1 Porin B precursor [Gimesia panareensis]QDU50164.1 Porin B precursor [Gimesia panareensis]
MRLNSVLHLIFLILVLSGPRAVLAQSCAEELPLESLDCIPITQPADDPTLIPDWFDSESGISVTPVYYGEVFTNAHGGIATDGSTQYEGLLNLSVDLDFEKMKLDIPGRASILFQNTHGRGLDEYVGATQILSNIDSFDNITQISELWWEVELYESGITMRVGKQDLSNLFLTMDYAGDFINSAFGLSPSAGLPSFPTPSPAVVFMTEIHPGLHFRVGGWDAYRSNANGLFSDNNAALFIGEMEYNYTTPFRDLPGKFTAGFTYHTKGVVPAGKIPRAFGYYIQFEQFLFLEADSTDDQRQGLAVFAQHFPTATYGSSPYPLIPHDALAGFVYTGLLRGRDQDVTGAGAGWVDLDQGGTDHEVMVEVFYKARINESLSIQPDLQYVTTPSGIYPDAFVAGLRFQLDL